MDQIEPSAQEPAAFAPRRRPRGHPVVAWTVVVGLSGMLVWWANRPPPPVEHTAADPVGGLLLEMQGRYLVDTDDLLRRMGWSRGSASGGG